MASRFRQWLGKVFSHSAPSRRTFRPRLEALEARDCPAIFAPTNAAELTAAITASLNNNQPDQITLVANGTYALTAALPAIIQDVGPGNLITIFGNGATITRAAGAPNFQIFNITDGRLELDFVTISNGVADNPSGLPANNMFGGGIRVVDATLSNTPQLILRNSLVTNNTVLPQFGGAGDGGGIFFGVGGKGLIINSTISNNTAAVDGGGISMLDGVAGIGNVTIINSTVAQNVGQTGVAGGINVDVGTMSISNTIVADNHLVTLAGLGSDLVNQGGTVNSINSLYQTLPVGINGTNTANQVGVNPLLGVLQNNGGGTRTHAIVSAASPAINMGANAQITAPDNVNDQRGPRFNRIISTIVDIGAYEFQPGAVSVLLTSNINPSLLGQFVTYTATVQGVAVNSNIPAGTVTFRADGSVIGTATLVNGVAAIQFNTLASGDHLIQASYEPLVQGDYAFNPGLSNTIVQTVLTASAPVGRRWFR